MNGLDTDKATDGPDSKGFGMAHDDSRRDGREPGLAPALREGEPAAGEGGAGEGGREAPTAAGAAGKGDTPLPPALPPTKNPWHHSRPRRGAPRGPRRGAAARPGLAAALIPAFVSGGLQRHFAKAHWPHIRPPLGSSWAPWLTGALVMMWVGATSLHPVGVREQAIVSTDGAWGPALGPGLAVSWPWPIGAARIEDVTTIRHLALPEGDGEHLILTRDAALVDLACDVRWRIRDLRAHARGLADPAATMRLAAENAMRATLAGMDFAEVMGAGRDALGHEAARRLQALLDRDRAGIAVDGIDLRRVDPPPRVSDALRAIAAARNDAATEATQARSWSRQVIVHAQGEAGAFDKVYAQYARAPDVTRRQMYYATMERVLAQSDKVIVDAPGTTTTLPLRGLGEPSTGHDAGGGNGR